MVAQLPFRQRQRQDFYRRLLQDADLLAFTAAGAGTAVHGGQKPRVLAGADIAIEFEGDGLVELRAFAIANVAA
ncbi:hypothetical protein D3C79_1069700 [compost metagenome]